MNDMRKIAIVFGAVVGLPFVVNWLFIRREISINLLMPIYIAIFIDGLN